MVTFKVQDVTKMPEEVSRFLENAGDLGGFRYFDKRPVEIVENHLGCLLIYQDTQMPIAYGHLDPEGDKTWLGIAVAESVRGQGWGRLMMQLLLQLARINELDAIDLSVDKDNVSGQKLYESLGFEIVGGGEYFHFMRWTSAKKR